MFRPGPRAWHTPSSSPATPTNRLRVSTHTRDFEDATRVDGATTFQVSARPESRRIPWRTRAAILTSSSSGSPGCSPATLRPDSASTSR